MGIEKSFISTSDRFLKLTTDTTNSETFNKVGKSKYFLYIKSSYFLSYFSSRMSD